MRWRVGAVAMLGVLALGGCGGGAPIPTLPPTPGAPIFATEEEALAAAEEAYAAYLEMSNRISSEGGTEPERIAPFVTGAFYDSAIDGFQTLKDNSWRTEGASQLVASELQFADLFGEAGETVVAAYVCIDVSGVDVMDAQGVSVVSPDRPDLQAFEVFFDLLPSKRLAPSAREPWEPGAVCGVG